MKTKLFLLTVFCGIIFTSTNLLAETNQTQKNQAQTIQTPTIQVFSEFESSKKELPLPFNTNAKLKVYLETFGDEMTGRVVKLKKIPNNIVLKDLKADNNGVVIFRNVPPGIYVLELVSSGEVPLFGQIKIGDYFLEIDH